MAKKNAVLPVGVYDARDIPVGAYDSRDTKPALRAAALLLDWAADAGNERVDGFIVTGISHTLRLVADRLDRDEKFEAYVAKAKQRIGVVRKAAL